MGLDASQRGTDADTDTDVGTGGGREGLGEGPGGGGEGKVGGGDVDNGRIVHDGVSMAPPSLLPEITGHLKFQYALQNAVPQNCTTLRGMRHPKSEQPQKWRS